jgi:hypothetical protein
MIDEARTLILVARRPNDMTIQNDDLCYCTVTCSCLLLLGGVCVLHMLSGSGCNTNQPCWWHFLRGVCVFLGGVCILHMLSGHT